MNRRPTVLIELAFALLGAFTTVSCKPDGPEGPFNLATQTSGSGLGQILCQGAPCLNRYDLGTELTLTASADARSVFVGWSGACSGNAPSCQLFMDGDKTLSAQFNLGQDSVQLTLSGTGTGLVTSSSGELNCGNYAGAQSLCSTNLTLGSTLTLTATPQPGSEFAGWSGACTGTAKTCTFTFSQAATLSAAFNTIIRTAPLITSIDLGQLSQGQIQALGMHYYIATSGIFPSQQGGVDTTGTPYLGQIMLMAANITPAGWLPCDGRLLSISSNTALFSILGTTYGGDGRTTFALPDLRAKTPIGLGNNGLPQPSPEGTPGVPVITSLGWGESPQGQAQVLGINVLIATQGIFPSMNSGGPTSNYLGQLLLFAGNFAPGGWLPCDGRVLSIAQNTALFSLLGTTYGGDGRTTFALPDLRARAPLGVGALAHPVSPVPGSGAIPLVSAIQLGESSLGQIAGLGMTYLVAETGIFPSSSGGGSSGIFVSQLMIFAGNFAPRGWAKCDGSLRNISTNTAFFSLMGTTYGGDGRTTFAVPDLRSHVPMSAP